MEDKWLKKWIKHLRIQLLRREHAKIGSSSSTTVTLTLKIRKEWEDELKTCLVGSRRASSVEIAKAFDTSQAIVLRHLLKIWLKQV